MSPAADETTRFNTTIDIKVSHSALLWHHVDALSRWDYHVGKHIYGWHTATFGIGSAEEAALAAYREIRSPLGWDAEIQLFQWAHAGFPDDSRFNGLAPQIEVFRRCSSDRASLDETLQKQVPYLERLACQVRRELESATAAEVIAAIKGLFPHQKHPPLPERIPAFIAWSPTPEASQGGANGIGVYTEVHSGMDTARDAMHVAEIFLHELLHLLASPKNWFQDVEVPGAPDLFRRKRSWIFEGREGLDHLMEEAIVLAVANVICFQDDIAHRQKHYESLSRTAQDERASTLALTWSVVSKIEPILRSFMAGQTTSAEVHESLIGIAHDLVAEHGGGDLTAP